MVDLDFKGLTHAHAQKELLSFQGWHIDCGRVQPGPRTVAKLIERRLLVRRDVSQHVFGGLSMTVAEYDVPIAVHIAWCDWCTRRGAR